MTELTAGQKADVTKVLKAYRTTFANGAKDIARRRVIQVLRDAGGETALDLWGGGVSAKQFVDAGFRVISIDDGSLPLAIGERPVRGRRTSAERSRLAAT